MAIYRSIFVILERSKKPWNFDVVLNGQKKSKNKRQKGQRARKSTTSRDRESDFRGSWPQGGHARDKKMDIGLWKMDNGQKEMENGKWQKASGK